MWLAYVLGSAICWSGINVLGSVLLHRYEQRISVLGWHLSAVSAVLLFGIALFFSLPREHLSLLLMAGVTSYGADYYYYVVLKRVEVSLSNLAWAMLSILLAILGIVVFGEQFSQFQLIGIACVLTAVMLLVRQPRLLTGQAVGWLMLLALSYLPFYAVQKYTLAQGAAWLGVFFWPMLARESCFLIVPLLRSSSRRDILTSFRSRPAPYFIGVVLTITLFFLASLGSVLAYQTGPLYLVSITGNIQPFLVLFLAALVSRMAPNLAPYEQTTWADLRAKALAFVIVFSGLAFMAVNQ